MSEQRFVKAIRFGDVKVGDVVCQKIGTGEVFKIARCESPRDPKRPIIQLYTENNARAVLFGHPDLIIGLVHREYPGENIWLQVVGTFDNMRGFPTLSIDSLQRLFHVLQRLFLESQM